MNLICRDSAINWYQLPSEIIWLQGSITTSLCTRMKVCNLPFSLYSIASFNLIVCSYSKSWKLSVVLAFNVRLINHEWLNNQYVRSKDNFFAQKSTFLYPLKHKFARTIKFLSSALVIISNKKLYEPEKTIKVLSAINLLCFWHYAFVWAN